MKTIIICFTIISLGFSQDLITVINSKYDNGNPKEEIVRKVIDDYNQPIVKKTVYCENGNFSEVIEYKDELINGLYQKFSSCWDEINYLETQINYELGKKNGLEQHFCKNGQKSYEVNYITDIKVGIEQKWNCNAVLTSKVDYSDGLIIGESYTYSEDYDWDTKQTTYKKMYKNYIDGAWDCSVRVEVLTSDMNLLEKYSGFYPKKRSKRDPREYPDSYCKAQEGKLLILGLYESWYKNGNKYQSINYLNGKYHGMFQQWFNNGEIYLIMNYSEHSLDGEYQSWYKNGQKQLNANYSSGIIDGSYKFWYDNGMKKRESFFVLGKFNGLDTKWSDDGTILYEKNYTMGNLLDYKIYSTNGSILIDQSIARSSNE